MIRSLLALASIAAVLCGCGPAAKPAPVPAAPIVEIVSVRPAQAAGAVRASGLVGFKRETILSFSTPGVIAGISVDIGDTVTRGQPLASLRRVSVGSNPNESAIARANAERQLARVQSLFDEGFASQAALDDARLAVERARDVAAIAAPADGVILRRGPEPGEMTNAGAAVLILGEARSGVVVRAPLPSNAAARVRVGADAHARVTGFETPFAGKVTRVAAKSNDATGAYEVEVLLNEADALRSGMVAEVEIAGANTGDEQPHALLIPPLALLDARADQGVVYVVDAGGVARRRTVQTAGIAADGVLILSGLEPGERVVASGAAYVRDGEPVRQSAASAE
jgi:RND family efflux transporter MFP subunit